MTRHFTKKENLTVLALVILFLACMFAGCRDKEGAHFQSEYQRYTDSCHKYQYLEEKYLDILDRQPTGMEWDTASKAFNENLTIARLYLDSIQLEIDSLQSHVNKLEK